MQFLDTQWHLLRGTHQQSRETNRVSLDLDGLIKNNVEWYLFAKVIDGIAIIAQNSINQILADIMDIAKDCCQYDLAFRIAFLFFQVTFQVRYGAFHYFGGL